MGLAWRKINIEHSLTITNQRSFTACPIHPRTPDGLDADYEWKWVTCLVGDGIYFHRLIGHRINFETNLFIVAEGNALDVAERRGFAVKGEA